MVAWKSHLLAKKFIWLTFCDHFEEVRLSVLPNGKGCLCIVLRQAIKIVMGISAKPRFRPLWKCHVQTFMGLWFLHYKSSKKLSPSMDQSYGLHKMLSSSLPDLSLNKDIQMLNLVFYRKETWIASYIEDSKQTPTQKYSVHNI